MGCGRAVRRIDAQDARRGWTRCSQLP